MHSESDGARPQSLYALVIYLPDPLGAFLDKLRLEMVPGCNPHAHVSVLPPRPLPVAPEAAIEEARRIIASFDPFEIELGGIEKFQETDVIYIGLRRGGPELREMHRRLGQSALAFAEPYAYHPHVTLAQEIRPDAVQSLLDQAEGRWREFPGPRQFRAENAVFVRNTSGNFWVDLATGSLRGAQVE
jgi:hypothetical protein